MSGMSDALHSTQAWISQQKSGTITPIEPIWVTRVLDMAESLKGFALRLRELRKGKNLSQTELGQLAELHYTHIGRY